MRQRQKLERMRSSTRSDEFFSPPVT